MKKFYILSILALTSIALIYSCSTEEEDTTPPPSVVATPEPEPPAPTQYTLTVSAGEGGTVSTEGGTYDEGTEVTITATPEEGYEFVGWEGSDSTENSLSINLNSSLTITAIFQNVTFNSISERYSPINETTRYYSLTSNFKRYISLEEAIYLYQSTGYRFSNFDAVTYDINEDGKLDLLWFGMSDNIWGANGGKHSNGKYFIISDYFNKTAPYEIIEFNSAIEFAAAGINAQDIDNDGIKEVLIYSNNVHQVNTSYGVNNFITDNSNPPEELGTVILKIDKSFNLISENIIGTPKALHRGGSGDVDNDGDIDILNFPTGHPVNKTIRQKFPTILFNDGNGNFTEELIFNDDSITNYYWSMDSTSSHLFDLNNDGYLDIIYGQDIGISPGEPPFIEGINWYINPHTVILWGDGSGKFSLENSSNLELINELNCIQTIMGMGFTDFDNDGDIDVFVLTTKEYNNYILNLFKNTGNKSFIDVTVTNIEGYYHLKGIHLGDMGEMMSIDKDNDGDYDLVPKDVKVFCCLSGGYDYVSDLYWENIGGKFVRRVND